MTVYFIVQRTRFRSSQIVNSLTFYKFRSSDESRCTLVRVANNAADTAYYFIILRYHFMVVQQIVNNLETMVMKVRHSLTIHQPIIQGISVGCQMYWVWKLWKKTNFIWIYQHVYDGHNLVGFKTPHLFWYRDRRWRQ